MTVNFSFIKYITLLMLVSAGPLFTNDKSVDACNTYSNIINFAYVMEDSDKNMDFDAIRAREETGFSALSGGAAGFTFSSSAYWFRFKIVNSESTELHRLLAFEPTWLDMIDVQLIGPSGSRTNFRGGDRYPFGSRSFRHPQTVFELGLDPGVSTVYVRVETRDPFVVSMALWDEHAFYDHDDGFSKYIGFFYGILIAMGVYNLFLFFAIRDRLYAFYVLYITFFLIMNFTYSGYAFPALWPEYPEWGNWAHSIAIYFYTLSGLLFATVFLNTREKLPRMHRAVLFYFGLVVATFIISSLTGGYAHNVMTSILFVVLFSLIAFILGIISWVGGNRTARFFILATTAGLFGAAITALTVSSILPFNFFTYRAADLGMILDAMLLSLALADRYKALERERDLFRFKEEKQHELLLQKEAFAKSLEVRVQEELQKNLKQEAVMLKQYQQAALGNMIGAIAHQLKQPLNAISLNVHAMTESYFYGELDDRVVKEMKDNVWHSISFMSTTIDDFRNYFRPDKQKKLFNLHEMIEKTLSLLGQQITIKGVDIEVSCDPAIMLESFENELQQVILNLVTNAMDIFAERLVGSPRITIIVEQFDAQTIITVEDNGGGIPDEALSHMFELYYTTKGEAGTGIGLYLSKTIVIESLGGEIGVANSTEGARFEIRIPAWHKGMKNTD